MHGTPMGWFGSVCVITCDLFSTCCLHAYIVLIPDSFMHAGLTCGLFTRKSEEVPCPDIGTGLYVRTRDNQVVKVTFFIRLEIDGMQM
jgi:hypothetical protein